MSAKLVGDLRARISCGEAIVVIGAGVAMAASGGAKQASWMGLLESGLSWCEAYVPSLPPTWPDLVRGLLAIGDMDSLVTAAEMITQRLGGREGGEYRRWLRETVGGLAMADPDLPLALAGLGVPMATTNYDDLMETACGWATVTWQDGTATQMALRGDDRAVMHLHGHWRSPTSVVLGIRSYEDVLGSAPAQALQQAMSLMRSMVFVGIGKGAQDPNFLALRRWLAKNFPGGEYRHFRLCLDGDVAALAAEHPPAERIVPIGYGSSHGDLAGFLRSLV